MKVLSVKNWEEFQHYKNRKPPWIKLYTSLLNDYKFLQMTDAERYQLIAIWLLASCTENRIPCDATYIRGQIRSRKPVPIEKFVSLGFLTVSQDASKMHTNACLETETETETETEKSVRVNGFDAFWESCPKKVGKQSARQAWTKIKPGAELSRAITQAMKAQVEADHFRGTDGKFYIPHPTTWLNAGRWEDEIQRPQTQEDRIRELEKWGAQ